MVTTLVTQVPGNKYKKSFSLKEEAFTCFSAASSFVLKPFCVKMNGMKAKKNVDGRSGSACYWEPCPCYEKVADDRKLMETQEES